MRKSMISEEYLQSKRNIFLRPVTGPSIKAKLVSVPLSLWMVKEGVRLYVQLHDAVMERLHVEALIMYKIF